MRTGKGRRRIRSRCARAAMRIQQVSAGEPGLVTGDLHDRAANHIHRRQPALRRQSPIPQHANHARPPKRIAPSNCAPGMRSHRQMCGVAVARPGGRRTLLCARATWRVFRRSGADQNGVYPRAVPHAAVPGCRSPVPRARVFGIRSPHRCTGRRPNRWPRSFTRSPSAADDHGTTCRSRLAQAAHPRLCRCLPGSAPATPVDPGGWTGRRRSAPSEPHAAT
jgi:hypothetical protein